MISKVRLSAQGKVGHSQPFSPGLADPGGVFIGQVGGPAGIESPIESGSLKDGKFTMEVQIYGPYRMKIAGTLNAGVLKGTYTATGPGNKVLDGGTLEAKKSPGPARREAPGSSLAHADLEGGITSATTVREIADRMNQRPAPHVI